MILFQLLLLALLLPILLVGPGFFFARWLRWSRRETLCASLGLSIVLIYLVATAIYLTNIPWHWAWLSTAGGIGLTVAAGRDLIRLIRSASVKNELKAFCLLLAAGLLPFLFIQHYSGGTWSADWLEHYRRMLFFLEHFPHDTTFIGGFPVPARPPLMNIVAAYFLAHTGTHTYDLFQPIFGLLNLLVFFPCILLAEQLVKFGSRRVWLIAAFLSLCPMVIENVTWTWTKLLASFYVLLSLSLYLRSWQKNDPIRMIAAALSMAAALLVHYSAGPYAVFLAIHYVIIFIRRKHKMLEMIGAGVAVTLLLATWFGWSIVFYGKHATFASNTTATETSTLSAAENLAKIGHNLLATMVPHAFMTLQTPFQIQFYQPNPFGYARDYFFNLYQTNFTFAWGLIGWAPLLWLAIKRLQSTNIALGTFWIAFIIFNFIVGVAVVGPREDFGLAHVCLQPLVLLGLTLLATQLTLLPLWARGVLVGMSAIDVGLGILLQLRMESLPIKLLPSPGEFTVPFKQGLLNVAAVKDSLERFALGHVYLADHLGSISWLFYFPFLAVLTVAMWIIVRNAFASQKAAISGAMTLLAAVFLLCSIDRMLDYDVADPYQPAPQKISLEQLNQLAQSQELAVRAAPFSAEARYELGRVCYDYGQIEPAGGALLDAYLLDPQMIKARYLLYMLMFSHGVPPGNTQAGAAEYVLLYPNDVSGYIVLAGELSKRGYTLPALLRIRQALRMDPNDQAVQATLSNSDLTPETLQQQILRMGGPP